MSSIPGRAPVVDFDGTVADLGIDWDALRRRLSVDRIPDLWVVDEDRWAEVERVELAAAEVAEPVRAMLLALEAARGYAVLTNNSEAAVARFLNRFPHLGPGLRLVFGRESLGGSKHDPERFTRAFRACVEATVDDRLDEPVVYVGDQRYELELAASLGAVALDVAHLDPGQDSYIERR